MDAVHGTSSEVPVKAGDSVRHRPSGESWLVAAVSPNGAELVCCGWPETIAKVGDCEVIERCSEPSREEMIERCKDGNDVRGSWTRELLRVREEHRQRQVAKTLTFAQLREANVARCQAFGHGDVGNWTPAQWAIAMAGEVGEVLGQVKKIWRGDVRWVSLADELADVVIYHDLLAARLGYEPVIRRFLGDLGIDGDRDVSTFRDLERTYRRFNSYPKEPHDVCSLATLLRFAAAVLDELCLAPEGADTKSFMVLNGKVLIAAQWVASAWRIDLDVAVVRKFNAVSDARKVGVRL